AWTAPTFTVHSSGPVAAAIDGEATVLDPPLVFRAVPAALRVRVPVNAPGRSPAARAARPRGRTVRRLVGVVAGRPAGRRCRPGSRGGPRTATAPRGAHRAAGASPVARRPGTGGRGVPGGPGR